MHGHDLHNTIILSIVHNMSTTCFGQFCFCPSSVWIQLLNLLVTFRNIANEPKHVLGVSYMI